MLLEISLSDYNTASDLKLGILATFTRGTLNMCIYTSCTHNITMI